MLTFLKTLGVACDRWITGAFPCQSAVSVEVNGANNTGCLTIADRTIDLTAVRSVWFRHPSPSALPANLDPEERQFADAEIRSALAGVFQLFDWFWVNHPDRVRVAGSKLLQLRRASELGFEVPTTIVTNDPIKVREFFDAHRDVVYKPFTSAFFCDGRRYCYTSPIAEKDLLNVELIRQAPGIFQTRIPKKFELRITVIGRRVFATEIHSQQVEVARDDWRAGDIEQLAHVPHCLPHEIEKRCLSYIRSFGLVFGAIDMIVTPQNNYVFLENNPSGQFGWIENLTGEPLTAALAELLIAGEVV